MQVLMLIGAGLLAAAFTFAINWLGLIPWRRAKSQHWTERARLYHPARVAAAANFWILPTDLTLATLLLWPDQSPHWILLVFATAIGTVAGTIPMDHEVFPQIPLNERIRLVAVGWFIRFALWFVFLGAIALMPDDFNTEGLLIATAFVLLCFLWNQKGWIWAGRKLGLFLPPPQRLQNIVQSTAAEIKVPVREIWVVRTPEMQALAMPANKTVLFTERLLLKLSDNEIAVICAHELAHLTETRSDYYQRYVLWLMFVPWLFVVPAVHLLNVFGFLILLFITAGVPRLYKSISRRLEARADGIATTVERDPGTYARALAKIYEDNLMPAVTEKKGTHPHLYDRLIAAGVTPDFQRPLPADTMAWYGHLLAGIIGLLATLFIIHLTQQWYWLK